MNMCLRNVPVQAARFQICSFHYTFAYLSSKRLLTVEIPELQAVLDKQTESVTESVFNGVPLAGLNPKVRGEIVGHVVRGVLSDMHSNDSFQDAVPGKCENGTWRGWNRSEYDWLWNGKRVECKGAQLNWVENRPSWKLRFSSIKSQHFDVLLLAFYTPHGIHIYHAKHPQAMSIQLYAPCGVKCWRGAVDAITSKLDSEPMLYRSIGFTPINHCRIQAAVASRSLEFMEKTYRGVPLAGLSPPSRGLRLQALVHAVDMMAHPCAIFGDPVVGSCSDGRSRGIYRAEYDWTRDGLRIECKHAQLLWDKSSKRWKLGFAHIKFAYAGARCADLFDELLLALYTPRGVYIYRHDLKLGISTAGKRTAVEGHSIQIYSSNNEFEWFSALDEIIGKLDNSHCEHIAFVPWAVVEG